MSKNTPELLTEDEKQLITDLYDCYTQFHKIVHKTLRTDCSETRVRDMAEIRDKLAILQNYVLAQAAARAYPETYRLLGEPQ